MKQDRLIVVGVAIIAIGLGVYLFLTGDVSNTTQTASSDQASAVVVPFTPLLSGANSTVTSRVNYFITSADQMSELWGMLNAAGSPPAVDFKKNAVVAVFAGEQPTTGYAIKVSKIIDSSARLVSITIAKPDSTCVAGQAMTYPYEIVVVPTTELPLAHEDLSATTDCKK